VSKNDKKASCFNLINLLLLFYPVDLDPHNIRSRVIPTSAIIKMICESGMPKRFTV
jgi:hypothetical protein